jgi:hypothetical protein
VAYYRLYFMHPLTGHIERVHEVEAASDDEAIRLIEAEAGREPLELWCGPRKVHRIEAVHPAPPTSNAA